MTKPLIFSALALLGSCALLPAATYFTEDFSDLSPNPNMALGTGLAGATTSFAASNFTITSGTGSRIYLGTNDTDYSAVDFVFQATVTVPSGTADGYRIVFFGMGSPNADGSNFGEPITGSDMFMALRPDTNAIESRDNATSATTGNTVQATGLTGITGSTHLLRMTWNATAKSALFEYDAGNDGSIDKSFTLNGADNSFTGANSQLVLGGGNGLIFDNISVVPEPSTALLGGFGLLGMLTRRRRR